MIAVVTGSAKRLGRELSLFLAKMGFDLGLHYNQSHEDCLELAGDIEKLGRKVFCFKQDLSETFDSEELLAEVKSKLTGELSLLVNNASIYQSGNLSALEAKDFDRNFAVHVRSPLLLIKAFNELSGPGSMVVNMLDRSVALSSGSDYLAYNLSKKSLKDITLMLAKELAPKLRVNGIAPGHILAPIDNLEADLSLMNKNIPLGRSGTVKEILSALDFLLRNEFITGQILYVDGGERLK